jgi:hypothetical protein
VGNAGFTRIGPMLSLKWAIMGVKSMAFGLYSTQKTIVLSSSHNWSKNRFVQMFFLAPKKVLGKKKV